MDEASGEIPVVVDKKTQTLEKMGLITDTHLPIEVVKSITNPLVELKTGLDRVVHLGDVAVESRQSTLGQTRERIPQVVGVLKDAVDDVLEGNADPKSLLGQLEGAFQQNGVDYHKGLPKLIKYSNLGLVLWPYNENVPDEKFIQEMAKETDSELVVILSHEPPFKVEGQRSSRVPTNRNIQGARILEYCRKLPKEANIYVVSGHTHLLAEELAQIKPYFHIENNIGKMRILGSANPTPETRRTINIIPLGPESGAINITGQTVQYEQLATPGDLVYRNARLRINQMSVFRERLQELGITDEQIEALRERVRDRQIDTSGLTPRQQRTAEEIYTKINSVFDSQERLNQFIEGKFVPDLEAIPPSEQEKERLNKAIVRLTEVLDTNQIGYKLVGGTWIETVARAHNLDYTRRHEDIDVIIDNPQAIATLRDNGYSLEEGMPDSAGNKEDYSGWDDMIGEKVGIFIQPIDKTKLVEVSVGGMKFKGEPLIEVYLMKKSNVQLFLSKELTPRPKDLADIKVLESMIDSWQVGATLTQEVDQQVLDAQAKIDETLSKGGISALRSMIENATLPEETKQQVSTLFNENRPNSADTIRTQLLSIYRNIAIAEIEKKYGVSLKSTNPPILTQQ